MLPGAGGLGVCACACVSMCVCLKYKKKKKKERGYTQLQEAGRAPSVPVPSELAPWGQEEGEVRSCCEGRWTLAMDERRAGRLPGARGLTGPKLTNKNHSKSLAAHSGEAADAWQRSHRGPGWEQVDGGGQRGTGNNQEGLAGQVAGSRPGCGRCGGGFQGWLRPAGSWASTVSPLTPWLPEPCAGHRRWSTAPGLFVQVWVPGVLQVAQDPFWHRIKQG